MYEIVLETGQEIGLNSRTDRVTAFRTWPNECISVSSNESHAQCSISE